MSFYIKDLLVNMLFIILPIITLQALATSQNILIGKFKTIDKLILIGVFSISSILCVSFPLAFEKMILDFRLIPFILATIYGGKFVGGFVLFSTLIARFIIGGSGFYFTLAEYILIIISIYFFVRNYETFSFRKKVLVVSTICIFPILVGIPFGYFSFGIEAVKAGLMLTILSLISMGFSLYLLENIKRNALMTMELHKSEKLSIVSHLAASISHEVRNPLTVTKGFLQILKTKYKSDEDTMYLKLALDELTNAENIITDYLNFAKPAIEKEEDINLHEILISSINFLKPYANIKNITISFEGRPTFIKGSAIRINQIFLNIFKNGIEAMTNGGHLSVLLLANSEFAQVIIKDNGVGMTQEQLVRLGEPYFSTKENGTGLGMMISTNIIKSMGGFYKVYSQPQKGTTFYISLPIVKVLCSKP